MKIQHSVRTSTLFSWDKYNIQWKQIQYPVTTNIMSSYDKCDINFRQQKKYTVKTYTYPVKTKKNVLLGQIQYLV